MEDNRNKSRIVDAIDEGRIVRVPETYALREGLPILRRKEISFLGDPNKQAALQEAQKKESRSLYNLDTFRRPLKPKKNEVRESLVDNFQWLIAEKRRQNNMSRKQFAEKIGVIEHDIKLIENGILPSEDYVLINKIQQFFGIILRKDGQDFSGPINAARAGYGAVPKTTMSGKYNSQNFRGDEKVVQSKPSTYLKRREEEKIRKQKAREQIITGSDIEIDFDSSKAL